MLSVAINRPTICTSLMFMLLFLCNVLYRFLTAPLWKSLLDACGPPPASVSMPSQDTTSLPDVPCSDMSSSLQDIISNMLEAPRLRPLLLVHDDNSFLSMLNRAIIVEEIKSACKVLYVIVIAPLASCCSDMSPACITSISYCTMYVCRLQGSIVRCSTSR